MNSKQARKPNQEMNNSTETTAAPTTTEVVTEKPVQKFDAAKFVQECGSKSAAIRRLTAEGKLRGEIAKMLGIRYQHVRNVLITPVKTPRAVVVAVVAPVAPVAEGAAQEPAAA